jgi:aspartate/methionine/tyrosine aminotransferase
LFEGNFAIKPRNYLPDFRLETHFAVWEFKARYHLTASDAETVTLDQLLAMSSDADRSAFFELRLGYTETRGAPDLRQEIARTYQHRSDDDILCFAGAEEGIFATLTSILDKDSHAIVVLPAYQSLESIPNSICATTGIPLDAKGGWRLDLDRIVAEILPETRVIIINFPHNPTGALLLESELSELIEICSRRGIWLFSDEAYRPLGPTGGRQLPQVADLYERGISLGVMSKAYGLPGLRIGWIACADRELLDAAERTKHYTSICNSGPSERLAVMALKDRERLLERNCQIVSDNLLKWEAFFDRHAALFEWVPPIAGCVSYPNFLGEEGVEALARDLADEAGVLILPASIYASPIAALPANHFRIGSGRLGLDAGLDAFDEFLRRRGE